MKDEFIIEPFRDEERDGRGEEPRYRHDEAIDDDVIELRPGESQQRQPRIEPRPYSEGQGAQQGRDRQPPLPEEEDSFLEKRVPSKAKQYLGSLLSGNILSRAEVRKFYPYLLFVAILMLLYISNVFNMQQLHRRHDRLAAEVKELRAQAMTLSSMRMQATRQSTIVRELQAKGSDLREPLAPPKIIKK